jgi:Outer membrane protein beta-barrel domain
MQDMSPDMEDLMRKAAEAYPLKEMDDRWDEIASKTDAPQPPAKKQSRYKRHFILVFLLLLFLFTGDYLMNHTGRDSINTNKIVDHPVKESPIKQETRSPATVIKKSGTETNENSIGTNDKDVLITKPVYNKALFNPPDFSKDGNDITNSIDQAPTFTSSTEKSRTVHHEILSDRTIDLKPNNFSFELHNQAVSLSQNSKQKNTSRVFRKKFYYGIAAGPSFNSVKEQNLKTGWNFGLLGGYHVGNRLSLETGIVLSQKLYSTSGDYFSMEKIGASMPPPMKIMEVDGNSRVIEIPFHIRYDLVQNGKHNIFSSAGFSSYLLTKEYNQYHTSTNGNMQMMYGTYKNNQQYLVASLDLGVGYEKNLWRNKSIRLEPYVQIPVKGIGVGKLQVMSTGLRIALIKRAN